jgi:ApbE superfamily uncharacterized protein (UPF0280 family)
MRPTARLLPGDRLHLQHGPSDLIIWAEGARDAAYRAAAQRFETIIAEIVAELPALREMLSPLTMKPQGQVAQRMHAACTPFSATGYLTRMAAVAGSVADEVLSAMCQNTEISRAYVNNGGDIALYLGPGTSFSTAIKGHDGTDLGRIQIDASDKIGGIATSGRHGRSQSLGIADSVTVLAQSSALADVAATLIANAVDLPGHSAITRRTACELDDASDLGELPVVTGCDPLSAAECTRALEAGARRADDFQRQDLIATTALFLQGHVATSQTHLMTPSKDPIHVQA